MENDTVEPFSGVDGLGVVLTAIGGGVVGGLLVPGLLGDVSTFVGALGGAIAGVGVYVGMPVVAFLTKVVTAGVFHLSKALIQKVKSWQQEKRYSNTFWDKPKPQRKPSAKERQERRWHTCLAEATRQKIASTPKVGFLAPSLSENEQKSLRLAFDKREQKMRKLAKAIGQHRKAQEKDRKKQLRAQIASDRRQARSINRDVRARMRVERNKQCQG